MTSKNFLPSIHFTLNGIRGWDSEIRYFLTAQILRVFTNKQVFKLKNVFFEFLEDNLIWGEIEKMIKSGNINFDSEKIYKSLNLLDHSPLSRFLLEIYLFELDRFLAHFSSDFNLTKNLLFFSKTKFNTIFSELSTDYLPIKLECVFQQTDITLNNFNKRKFNFLKVLFVKKVSLSYRLFSKKLFYIRYLDHILLGLISAKNVVMYLERKLISFLRSFLSFDLFRRQTFNSSDNSIFFLSFHIRLISKRYNSSSFYNFKNNKKYIKRLFARSELYQKLWIVKFICKIINLKLYTKYFVVLLLALYLRNNKS